MSPIGLCGLCSLTHGECKMVSPFSSGECSKWCSVSGKGVEETASECHSDSHRMHRNQWLKENSRLNRKERNSPLLNKRTHLMLHFPEISHSTLNVKKLPLDSEEVNSLITRTTTLLHLQKNWWMHGDCIDFFSPHFLTGCNLWWLNGFPELGDVMPSWPLLTWQQSPWYGGPLCSHSRELSKVCKYNLSDL